MQEASQQVRDLQKQNKALVAELERLQRVKDARIAQLEQARAACPWSCSHCSRAACTAHA